MSISSANPTVATYTRYVYTATGGETSISGADSNGLILAYTIGKEQVFLNGTLLVRGSDYTATTGTSITGLTALVASDIVEILIFTSFSITDAIVQTTVDAKGDLLVGSAADSVSRLAVGNSGETLVADSSTSTGLRWQGNFAAGKNKIINGDFGIWQRGTSFSAVNAYTADRFDGSFDGSGGTRTVSQQTFTPGTAPVAGYEGWYFYRYNKSVGGTGGTVDYILRQKIEDVRTLAGQTVTISFWAKANTNLTVTSVIQQNFGSGGSTAIDVGYGNHSVTTSWQRFSATYTLGSASGKTIGTNSYLMPFLYYLNTNGTFTIDIWGVQLEAGSVATAFQTATGTLAGELAACQRYYLKSYAQATAPGTASNTVGNTGYSAISATSTNNRWNVRFPVNMRGTPTVTIYSTNSGTSAKIYNEQAAVDVDAATQFIGESGFHLYTSSGTPTAGHQLLAHYVASAEL